MKKRSILIIGLFFLVLINVWLMYIFDVFEKGVSIENGTKVVTTFGYFNEDVEDRKTYIAKEKIMIINEDDFWYWEVV